MKAISETTPLRDAIDQSKKHDPIVVVREGEPVAVIVDYEDWLVLQAEYRAIARLADGSDESISLERALRALRDT